MSNFLKNTFGKMDQKMKTRLLTFFIVGVLLIFCGSTVFSGQTQKTSIVPEIKQEVSETFKSEQTLSYEEQLEKRLKSVYENVEGAGKVEVLLTLSNGKEIIVAEDITSQQSTVKETDGNAISREQSDYSSQGKKIIISGGNGFDTPLILKEIEPKVEGVVIVCEGGDNVIVVDALIRATQTVLGVEPHKVQVLKMKKN